MFKKLASSLSNFARQVSRDDGDFLSTRRSSSRLDDVQRRDSLQRRDSRRAQQDTLRVSLVFPYSIAYDSKLLERLKLRRSGLVLIRGDDESSQLSLDIDLKANSSEFSELLTLNPRSLVIIPTAARNGVLILKNANLSVEDSWKVGGALKLMDTVFERIERIEISSKNEADALMFRNLSLHRLEVEPSDISVPDKTDPLPTLERLTPTDRTAVRLHRFVSKGKPALMQLTIGTDETTFEAKMVNYASGVQLVDLMKRHMRPRFFLIRGSANAVLFGWVPRESREQHPAEAFLNQVKLNAFLRSLVLCPPGGLRISLVRCYRFAISEEEISAICRGLEEERDPNPKICLRLSPSQDQTVVFNEKKFAAEEKLNLMACLADFEPVARPPQAVIEPS